MNEPKKAVAVKYDDLAGNEVKLNATIVKKYLCQSPDVTEQELVFFLKLCEAQKLNPFLREAYLVKYGRQAASIVVGKEAFLKRARRDPSYKGFKAWTDGKADDLSLTATCEVFVDGFECPISVTVDLDEYIGRKKDGSIAGMWATKPKTMLRKVALVQAHREAFPDALSGLYSAEEIQEDHNFIPSAEETKKEIQFEASVRKEAARQAAEAKEESEDLKPATGIEEEKPDPETGTVDKPARTVEEAQAKAKAIVKAKQEAEEAEAKEAKKKAAAEKRKATLAAKKAAKEAEEAAKTKALKDAQEAEQAAEETAEEEDDTPRLVVMGKADRKLGKKPENEFREEGTALPEYVDFIVDCFQVAFERSLTKEMLEITVGCEADRWTSDEKKMIFDLYGELQQGSGDMPATLARLFPEFY
jgi:phage recombination protein Bet